MGNKILQLSKSTEAEWLGARGLGASEVGAAMGVSPFQTPFQLWAQKSGVAQADHDEDTKERFFWGHELEAIIAVQFAKRTNLFISKNDFLFADEQHPWMTATPDYWTPKNAGVFDADGSGRTDFELSTSGVVQIKTTSSYNAEKFKKGIPDYIFCQVQQEMAVTGANFAYVACLVGGQKLVISERIEKDSDFIAAMHEQLIKFWEGVQSGTPPAPQAEDADYIGGMFPKAQNRTVDLDDRFAAMLDARAGLLEQIKALEAQKKQLEAAIKFEMGDADTAKCGNRVVLWEQRNREGYVVQPTTYRQFTVKERK